MAARVVQRVSGLLASNSVPGLVDGVRAASMAARCRAGRNKIRDVQPNPKKLMIAQRVREVFESNSMVVVFQYNDMNCKEWDELRFALSSNEVSVKVFPNKVTCKALEDTVYHAMSPLFLSSTCVMYSEEPKIKAMVNAAKQQPKLELLGAKVDDRLLSRQDIAGYAKLPPKDELYVELVQLLSKPALRMSMLLQQNQSKLSSNLSAYAKQ